jgi:hypothetical protein
MSELDVAVSALVEVHEVHIHGLPGNFCIILSVEVEQGLLEILQTLNPHLGGRECVHPGDHTYALLFVVGSLHHSFHFFGRVGGAFVYHFDGDETALVQALHHFLGVTVYDFHSLTAVKELSAGYPPQFKILKCFHNSYNFIRLIMI